MITIAAAHNITEQTVATIATEMVSMWLSFVEFLSIGFVTLKLGAVELVLIGTVSIGFVILKLVVMELVLIGRVSIGFFILKLVVMELVLLGCVMMVAESTTEVLVIVKWLLIRLVIVECIECVSVDIVEGFVESLMTMYAKLLIVSFNQLHSVQTPFF